MSHFHPNMPTWKVDEGDVIIHIISAPGLVDDNAAVSRALEKL